MKKILLLTLFTFCFLPFLRAQDVIVKKSGDEIKVKIIEISGTDIKYKKHDNPDGPLFYVPKTDVFMVKYEDGTKETFVEKPVTPKKGNKTTHVPTSQVIKLNGPRVGVTYVGPGAIRSNLDDYFDAKPVLSQFGWAFETYMFTTKEGASGTVQFIPLIAGVEQGLFLPSASALVGVRTPGGIEFAIGPNLSLAGAGMMIMAGTTFKSAGMNFPVNVSVVPSNRGFMCNLLVGFNIPKN